MTVRWMLFASAFALCAACGEGETPTDYGQPDEGDGNIIALPPGGDDDVGPRPETATEREEDDTPPRVAVSDVLGTFEGDVSGLAIWEHPSLSFESAVLAANGEAGLAVVPIDTDVAGSAIEGVFDGGVAVGYPGLGRTLIAAASGEDILIFEAGAEREFDPVGRIEGAGGGQAALCMVGSTLLRAATTGVSIHALEVGPDGLSEERTALALSGTGCAATKERFFVKTGEASVVSLSAEGVGEETAFAVPGEDFTTLSAIAAIAQEPGQGTLLAATESGTLVGSAFPFAGGETTGAVIPMREGREDLGFVAAMAAGSGNFGSVYRDGVVALVDGEGRLKLIPWAGLSRAFGQDGNSSRSIRSRDARVPQVTVPVPASSPE